MRNSLFVFILCGWFLWPCFATAQSKNARATVSGYVIDGENNVPLPGAVVLIDTTLHALTDAKGQFTISNVPMAEVQLSVSYLGYKKINRTIEITQRNTNLGVIRMEVETNKIEDVVVTTEAIIAVQKGDTVQYNAGAFKTNPDADASDLLSKMPGMTIEDNKVEAQGEEITRVYVDGKLLFGDDPMSALNNLPADVVESIQMFDEQSDESKFTGFDDGKRSRALNVVTKHKINRSMVGRFNGGYGQELGQTSFDKYKNRYGVNADFSSFTDKSRWTAAVNIGNVELRRGRFGRRGGGLSTNQQVTLGYANEWKDKIKLTGNYRFNGSETTTESAQMLDYYPTELYSSRIYRDTSYSESDSYTHNANIRFEYEIDSHNRLLFTPNVSFGNTRSMSLSRNTDMRDGRVLSYFNSDNNSAGNNFNTAGQLLYTHVFGKPGRALTTNIDYQFGKNNSDAYQRDSTTMRIDSVIIHPSTAEQIDTSFWRSTPRWLNNVSDNYNKVASVRLTYAEPIGAFQRVSVNYRFRYEDSKSDLRAYDLLLDDINNMDTSLSNTYSRHYFSHSAGLGYNLHRNNSNLDVGLDYQRIELVKNQQFPQMSDQNRYFSAWAPRLEYRYDLDKRKFLRLNYSGETGIPSVEELQNVVNSSNMQRLSAGNPNLKQSYSHTLRLDYGSSNIEKSTNFFLGFQAVATRNRVSNRLIEFSEETVLPEYNNFVAPANSQLTLPVNVNGYYSTRIFTGFSFPLRKLKTNVNLNAFYRYERNPTYTGDVLNISNGHTGNVRVGFVSNISENVDFNISSSTNFTYAANTVRSNTRYIAENVRAQINIIFLGGFVFTTDFSYQYNHNAAESGYTQQYCLWNAGIGRKFFRKRQGELRFTVYDLLKQNRSLSHSISANYIQDTWTNTLGRYFMVTFSYRFNSLNALSRGQSSEGFRGGPPEGGPGHGMPPMGGPGFGPGPR